MIDRHMLQDILNSYRDGRTDLAQALEQLRDFPYRDLGFATVDTHRHVRTGHPEVVMCQGKRPEHLRGIVAHVVESGAELLATRADAACFEAVRDLSSRLRYDPVSQTIALQREGHGVPRAGCISVVTAGTSDVPVAEEAAVTAEFFGSNVARSYDVGVAGIHRLFARIDTIRKARVVVVVAGMEGALPSVVGGLVGVPVVAVPTSVGYGASFGGLAALLSMLCGCAPGVSVVNIDNGFGAGYIASMINNGVVDAGDVDSRGPA